MKLLTIALVGGAAVAGYIYLTKKKSVPATTTLPVKTLPASNTTTTFGHIGNTPIPPNNVSNPPVNSPYQSIIDQFIYGFNPPALDPDVVAQAGNITYSGVNSNNPNSAGYGMAQADYINSGFYHDGQNITNSIQGYAPHSIAFQQVGYNGCDSSGCAGYGGSLSGH